MQKDKETKPLKAFILAAGYGTRLRSVTGKNPKPLVPFMSQPTLFHILDQLKEAGLHEVCINLHHETEAIKNALTLYSKGNLEISLSEETNLLGTGGALSAKRVNKWRGNAELLVINADIIHTFDLKALIRTHQKRKNLVTLAVNKKPQENKTVLWCKDDLLCSFSKKQSESEVPHSFACMHVLSNELLKKLPEEKSFSIISVYEELLREGKKISIFPSSEFWADIGDPKSYKECHLQFLQFMKEGKVLQHPAFKNIKSSIKSCEEILLSLQNKEPFKKEITLDTPKSKTVV